MLPIRAFGQYGVQIVNTRKFLTKLVGTTPLFNRQHLTSYFRGLILTRAKDCIARTIVREKVSVLEIAAHLNTISKTLEQEMAEGLEEFGLKIVSFFVNSITTPEDDPAVMTLKAALAKRAEMDILGYTYQQERSFDTMERAAGNEGSLVSPLMGAGIGLGMGAAIGGPLGGAFSQIMPNIQPGAAQVTGAQQGIICPKCHHANAAGMRFCAGCGGQLSSTNNTVRQPDITCDKCRSIIPRGAKFCPSCADPVNSCPECGEDNSIGAKQCRRCDKAMPINCSNCKAVISTAIKFCPDCGNPTAKTCVKCGSTLPDGAKFCANCGTAP